jgi:sugar diacid utilization regulator
MQALQLKPQLPLRFVAVRADGEADVVSDAEALAGVLRLSGMVFVARVGNTAAVLLQSRDLHSSPLASIREALRRNVPEHQCGTGLRVGVGADVDCENAHESWAGALLATQFARPLSEAFAADPCGTVVGYEELGGIELLVDLPPDRLRRHRDVVALESVIESTSGALDIEALEAFCRTGSLRLAAQSLYLHHSTVAVRLSRVEASTGWNLNDPDDRFRARFSLWARRLTLFAPTR